MGLYQITFTILIITLVGNIFLGTIGFLRAPKEWANRYYFLLILLYSAFLTTSYLTDITADPVWSPIILKTDFIVGTLTVYAYILFTSNFPKYRGFPGKVTFKILGLISAFLICAIVATNWIIKEISLTETGTIFTSGLLDPLFVGSMILMILFGIQTLIKQYKISVGREKLQVSYLIIGSTIPAITTIITSLILERLISFNIVTGEQLPITLLRQFGFASGIAFTLCTTYAIIRHRLFGIRVLAGEIIFWVSTAAFLFVTFYSVALLELEYLGSLVSPSAITLNVFLAFLIALILNIYGKKLRRAIRRYIVNISFDPVQVKEQFLADISVATDTDEILTHLTGTTKRLYSPSNQGILVAHTAHNDHVTTHWKEFLPQQVQLLENPDNLNLLLNTTHGKSALLTSQIVKNEPDSPLAQLLDALDTEIIIPLEHQGIYVLYLLGRKTNNHAYTNEDLTLLEQLCYYTVLNLARTT